MREWDFVDPEDAKEELMRRSAEFDDADSTIEDLRTRLELSEQENKRLWKLINEVADMLHGYRLENGRIVPIDEDEGDPLP